MNVMKEAHKATRAQMAKASNLMSYRAVLRVCLRHFHDLNKAELKVKAMQQKTIKLALIDSTFEANKDATWFSVEGTAMDSEGNRVHIGYAGSTIGVQAEADWYFCSTNGFTNIDLYACVWGLEDVKESFKIIK